MSSATIKRVCPLLERESPSRVLSYAPAPWVLRQCLETGFVFLENPPGYESFVEDYAWEVTSSQESASRQAAEPVLYPVSTAAKRLRSQVLKRNKIRTLAVAILRDTRSRRINLLDMGCGWGGLPQDVISSLPEDVQSRCVPHGIELSKELARISYEKFAGLGGMCVHDNALNGLARFPTNYFDLVVMLSFLEHEINPLPLLRRSTERLKPEGHIILKVPNYGCFNRTVRGARWCGFRWPDHVNYFTPTTLRAMAARAGLRVARMNFLDRHPFSDNMYAVLQKPLSTEPTAP